MNENNKDFEKEYDSFKDVAEFQNNMFNPGHYIGTGKVPPTVSAPGNAAPMAVFCFITSAGIFAFGLWLFFSDARVVSSGLIESPLINKIIVLIIMSAISLFDLLLALGYTRKAKRYRKDVTKRFLRFGKLQQMMFLTHFRLTSADITQSL